MCFEHLFEASCSMLIFEKIGKGREIECVGLKIEKYNFLPQGRELKI